MARVTVEDCIDKVPNRFELVLLAAHRSREISKGDIPLISRDNDKNPVVSLREIAEETVSPSDLMERLIHSLQKHAEADEPDESRLMIELAKMSESEEEAKSDSNAESETKASSKTDSKDEDKAEETLVPLTEELVLKGIQELQPPEQTEEI